MSNKQLHSYGHSRSKAGSQSGGLGEATQYSDFLDEVFEGGSRQKQLVEDAESLLKEMDSNLRHTNDQISKHKDNDRKLADDFMNYRNDLNRKRQEGKRAIQSFEQDMQRGQIINKNQFIKIKINDLMDVPKTNKTHEKVWFDEFKREQFEQLREGLEELGGKLFRARMTDEIQESRDKIDRNIEAILEDIQNDQYNLGDQKIKLIQLEKLILELEQYDAIIPSIIADLINKATEYSKHLLILSTEFQNKCASTLEEVQKSTFQNDKAYKYEFVNLGVMDPVKTRVNRYKYALLNQDLQTLHEGVAISEKIPFFFIEYFRERNNYQNLQSVQETFIMPSRFFEQLIPPGGVLDWNNMNYKDVKGFTSQFKGIKNTVLDKYQRILIGVLLSESNFLLVEIKTRPEHEILIYDSNYDLFQQFHEKIIRCIKAYIVEELRDKTDLSEGECIEFSRTFVGRSVNCPQVNFPQENGIFFLKNLQISSDGQNVTPFSYRHDSIKQFRLEIFSALLRIGINEDRSIPFDVLI